VLLAYVSVTSVEVLYYQLVGCKPSAGSLPKVSQTRNCCVSLLGCYILLNSECDLLDYSPVYSGRWLP
jgi:hypothetical protein